MLWHMEPRSPPPPVLSSSTPEIECHLTTMEDPISGLALPADVPSADAGDVPAATALEATEEACSPLHDTQLPSAEQPLPKDDNTNLSTAPQIATSPKRKRVVLETARRARPRVLILLTCVSHLLFHFMGLDLGLQLIEGYTKPRLLRAQIQFVAATISLVHDDILEYQNAKLLGTTLEPRYLEDYEHCLARGIREADKVFNDIDFTQSSETRNSTMNWVTENCDRLAFTPQVYNPNISNLWLAVHHARRVATEVFSLFKYKATLLGCRLLNQKLLVFDTGPAAMAYSRVPAVMPHGFAVDCEGRSRCRLVFTGRTNLHNTREAFKEALDKADKEVKKWNLPYKNVHRAMSTIILLLVTLRMLIANAYVTAEFLAQPPPLPSTLSCWARIKRLPSLVRKNLAMPQGDDLVFFGCFPNVLLYLLLNTQMNYIISELGSIVLPVAVAVFIFHWSGLIGFVDPTWHKNSTESLPALTRAIKDLYLLARGIEVPDLSSATHKISPAPCTRSAPCSAKAASKIGTKFISPLTPISEDLQQERKAMHEEQGKQTTDSGELEGYATESEDEFEDTMHRAGYVDLSGGATPTVSEDEGEWAVVEE